MHTKHRSFQAGDTGRFGARAVKGIALVERLGINYDNRSLPDGDRENPLRDNKLGITKKHLLDHAEAVLTPVTIQRALKRLSGQDHLGFKELRTAHGVIFGDIYPWAGQVRRKDISKETPFAPFEKIPAYMDRAFADFHKRNAVNGNIKHGLSVLSDNALGNVLAKLYSDLNAVHPFPEGNGRSNRTIVTEFARRGGRDLDWGRIKDEKAAFDRASELAKNGGDIEPLASLFRRTVVPLSTPHVKPEAEVQAPASSGRVKRLVQSLSASR